MRKWNIPPVVPFQKGIADDPQTWHGWRSAERWTIHLDRQRAALEAWRISTGYTKSTGYDAKKLEKLLKKGLTMIRKYAIIITERERNTTTAGTTGGRAEAVGAATWRGHASRRGEAPDTTDYRRTAATSRTHHTQYATYYGGKEND